MSRKLRMVNIGTGTKNYVLCYRKMCSGVSLHEVDIRIFG